MPEIKRLCFTLLAVVLLYSCSKTYHPSAGSGTVIYAEPAKTEMVNTKTEVVKAKPRTATPKVIIVNDNVARRSVDGRYFYDLDGHRYWRNNKDGKYYLFHKSMFDDPAFKSTKKN